MFQIRFEYPSTGSISYLKSSGVLVSGATPGIDLSRRRPVDQTARRLWVRVGDRLWYQFCGIGMDLTHNLCVKTFFFFEAAHWTVTESPNIPWNGVEVHKQQASRHFRIKKPSLSKLVLLEGKQKMIAAMFDRLWGPGGQWDIFNWELHLACI